MKATRKSLAPSKASLPRRVLGINFLGIDWGSISFRAPYNNFYPVTMCSGNGNRFWSNPHNFGYFANRTMRIHTRNAVLLAPCAWCFLMTFVEPDWYTALQQHYRFFLTPVFGMQMPQSLVEARRKELDVMAREKPGVLLKHKAGGQVSIPGSQALVV